MYILLLWATFISKIVWKLNYCYYLCPVANSDRLFRHSLLVSWVTYDLSGQFTHLQEPARNMITRHLLVNNAFERHLLVFFNIWQNMWWLDSWESRFVHHDHLIIMKILSLMKLRINDYLLCPCEYDYRSVFKHSCFASSPRRPDREYKRMVFEHTHGLFIT